MLKTCQKSFVLPMNNVSVCAFKTSPFVPAPRAHMLKHVCAWCRYKRGRFERTHGDVLSGHTGFFQCATPHTTHHHTTQNNTQQHTETETDRDRQRQRKKTEEEDRGRRQRKKTGTERESKTEEERQDKRRGRKRRRQEERRFIFSVVVHGRS